MPENLLWRQTEPPQHPKESTAWNIKILNLKSYALVKYNLHSKWTAARCCQRFPSIFASIFPNSEDISKVDACIQQDYRIDLITWYDVQWPNNSLKQNCPQSLCLAFCCCGPDSADRCWWHLFLTGVPSGTTTVSDVPHFIKFHKDNAFVSLTLQHSSVLIMPEKKQMPWLVISKCQVQNLPHHPIPHPSPSHPVFLFCFFAVPGLWATRTKTLNISQSHTRDFTTNPCRWWILLLFVESELGTKNPATLTKNQNNTIHSVLMQHFYSWNFEVGVSWL